MDHGHKCGIVADGQRVTSRPDNRKGNKLLMMGFSDATKRTGDVEGAWLRDDRGRPPVAPPRGRRLARATPEPEGSSFRGEAWGNDPADYDHGL